MDWRGLTRHDLPQFARLLMYDMGKVSWFLQSFLIQVFKKRLVLKSTHVLLVGVF